MLPRPGEHTPVGSSWFGEHRGQASAYSAPRMSASGEKDAHEGRIRNILLAAGAVIGAGVLWGWLKPDTDVDGEPTQDALVDALAAEPVARPEAKWSAGALVTIEPSADGVPTAAAGAIDATGAPAWVRPTIVWTVALVAGVVAAVMVLGLLRQVVLYLLLALFFSFAMEPAVTWMHQNWHWSRGGATALLLGLVFLALLVLVLVFVPTLLKGASAIAERLPQAAQDAQTWAKEHLNADISTTSIQSDGQQAAASLSSSSNSPGSVLLGFTTSLIGGIFGAFTVAMFIFYMVADGPQFRRAILSFFRPQRQEELLSIWEAAIEKTGGYFYSRLLLAGINGGLFYVVLRIVGVPGAAALAFFEGSVAAFIPIVGTYISATVPIIVAFITVGSKGALALLIYVLIYQQVENYLISPKIQGKTMQLHPAVAFGAALAGGAIGGLLWAFLALPFAATVQASASLWFQRHEVVESQLTHVEPPPPTPDGTRSSDEGLVHRGGQLLRSTRGWLRRVT
jgi:predicted PurR-regulated permease PerM